MVNTKIKRTLCALAAAACLFACTGEAVSAGTIPFTVTVGGNGSQDPLSKREIKRDGEQNAYFTGTYTSNKNCSIIVRSYNKNKPSIRSKKAVLNYYNIGKRQTSSYEKKAPAKQYYYMKAEPFSGRITVKGRYCP